MAMSNYAESCPQSVPDSLQDLCIFYCTNNLDIVVSYLNSLKDKNDDISSSFSLLLGNRMLEYYLRCHINDDCDTNREYFETLLQNKHLCNSLSLKRRGLLRVEDVKELANNSIQSLNLACFDEYTALKEGFESLVENNLSNLTSVKLTQKTSQKSFQGLLKLLCGSYPNEDLKSKNKRFRSGGDGNGESASDSDPDEWQPSESQPCKTSDHGFMIEPLDCCSGDCKLSIPASNHIESKSEEEHHVPNLKSFTFIQCYGTSNALYMLLWAFELPFLLRVVEKNVQLQSICIVTMNPCMDFLSSGLTDKLKNLQSLILSSVINPRKNVALGNNEYLFENLPALKKLRHLDLSCDCEGEERNLMKYSTEEVASFIQAVKDMPQLKSFDVSGTNLSEIVGHKDKGDPTCKDHCMPGFEGRRFEYIGLFNCDVLAHKYIPTLKLSGTWDEDQLLVALWSYHHNNMMMARVLNELQLHINAVGGKLKHPTPFIEGCMAYLEEISEWDLKYSEAKLVEQKNVESCLMKVYYLLKYEESNLVTVKQKRMRLERLLVICDSSVKSLNAGHNTAHHQNHILRLAIILMLTMDIECVAVYSNLYEQYLQALINIILSRAGAQCKQISLRLIHSACRISQELKARAGSKVKLVKILLSEVQTILSDNGAITERFEKMWSIIWTLTDEVPSNCEQFLRYSGCQIIKRCFETFPKEHELQRKISGAMNNVSENAHLRPYLMMEDLIKMFRTLLTYDSNAQDFDSSSHAAGVLVLLASDGPEAWTIREPTRDVILEEVDKTIRTWNICRSKGVRFRSLTPMIIQIENFSTPVAQYWGAWMICNLVIVKATAYCDMLILENGLDVIDRTLQQQHTTLHPDLVGLLQQITEITKNFKQERELGSDVDS